MQSVKSKARKHVSCEQMDMMLEFLQENVELARGQNRGGRGRILSLKLWNQCAKKLNTFKNGTVKDGKGWAKYWCDWKFRVRRKALEIQAAKESNDGDTGSLSTMEQTVIRIIGERAVDGVLIKTDPLADGDVEANHDFEDVGESTSANEHNGSAFKTTRFRRKRSFSRASESDDNDHEDPGDPEEGTTRREKFRKHGDRESDPDQNAERFLKLEQQNLEALQSLRDAAHSIAASMARLVDVVTNMRDILINNRNGLL